MPTVERSCPKDRDPTFSFSILVFVTDKHQWLQFVLLSLFLLLIYTLAYLAGSTQWLFSGFDADSRDNNRIWSRCPSLDWMPRRVSLHRIR